MTISSRTPEGLPHHCPICGDAAALEPSFCGGDSTCPRCGHLLWWFRDRLGRISDLAPDRIGLESSLRDDLGVNSLDLVELVMAFEEEFDFTIPAEEAEKIQTVGQAILYVLRHRGDSA